MDSPFPCHVFVQAEKERGERRVAACKIAAGISLGALLLFSTPMVISAVGLHDLKAIGQLASGFICLLAIGIGLAANDFYKDLVNRGGGVCAHLKGFWRRYESLSAAELALFDGLFQWFSKRFKMEEVAP